MKRRAAKAGSFIKGVVLGGIACGITALLWAPKSGKKLRQDIKDKYHDTKESTQEVLEDLCANSKEFAKDTKKAAKNFMRGLKK